MGPKMEPKSSSGAGGLRESLRERFGRLLEAQEAPQRLPRGSPERPRRAPGAPQEAQREPQEVQNEPQEAPNDPQEGQNEPQEGQSELREVPGGFRERFRNDFRGIFEQPARASKGCTPPTTLAIFMLTMLSPRCAICFVVPPGALLWFFSPFFVLLSSCFPSLRAACFRSLPRDRARKLRTKTLEKLTKRSSSKRPASARSARARAARDPPHSQS